MDGCEAQAQALERVLLSCRLLPTPSLLVMARGYGEADADGELCVVCNWLCSKWSPRQLFLINNQTCPLSLMYLSPPPF